MISLMLVAGDRTEQFAKFMEERGTFTINHAYESLSLNLSKIKDSIVAADQLVYLYQEEIIDIRVDMLILKDMIINNGFFTVKEIVFIVPECRSSKKAVSYFSTVMKDSGFTKYTIKEVGEKPSFNDVYDAIIGISKSQRFNNTYANVYRVERGVESKVAYEAQDDVNLLVEPFDYENVKSYELAKVSATKTESGFRYQDLHDDGIEKFNSPKLGRLRIESVLPDTESYIVTGFEKSGVTTWTIALAESTMKTGAPVTVIDFTDNRDVRSVLESQGLSYNEVSMLSMIKLYQPMTSALNLCTIHNERENSVKFEFLQNLYSNNSIPRGYIFIATGFRDMMSVAEILCMDLKKTIFCLHPIDSDVYRVQNFLAEYTKTRDTVVVLNDRVELLGGMQYLQAGEVKALFPFDVPVVQPIKFTSLDTDITLFRTLIKPKEALNG